MNIIGLLLIVFGTAASLLEGVFIKRYNSKHYKGGFLFTSLISLGSMLYFAVTNPNGFQVPPTGVWVLALLGGVTYCAASLLTYLALQYGSYAITMLVLSFSLLFSIFYGFIVLKEPLTVPVALGLVLLIASRVVGRAPKAATDDQQKASLRWIVCVVLSVVCAGMYGVFVKMQQHLYRTEIVNYDHEFMILCLGLSFLILFIIGLVKDGKDLGYIVRHGALYGLLGGVANGLTNWASLITNTMFAISVAAPLRSGIKIVMSFLVSALIFREKFTARQLVGVALGMVALILLNL